MAEYVTRQTYWCITCADDQIMDRAKMIEHLRQVHNIEPAKSNPASRLIMAFDFTGGYSNTWELTLNDVVFRKNITQERVTKKRSK
jgi:hypothetical protein